MHNGVVDAPDTVPCVKPPIQRVLIVGAGVAGLSAARALQKQGIAFDIIEAQADVGGVWNSGYEGLRAQGGR
jgi:cation diffusion facilitator CzcD-associated flavoprotein CzcO